MVKTYYGLNFIKNKRDNKSKDIHEDLIKDRDVWFRVLSSHKDSFGRIPLPHPAPMLIEKHIEGRYLLPVWFFRRESDVCSLDMEI
jgi:hypothetical protein